MDASVRMSQVGAKDRYGWDYPAIAYKDAMAVSSSAFAIKRKVSEARGRIYWTGAQYSTAGA